MTMKKFSDHTAAGQLGRILAIMAFVFGAGGSFVLWAADARIDQKYATDADVLAVQETVRAQVTTITTSVQENTKTIRATANSVDALTLVILDVRIETVEEELTSLEKSKRTQGAGWNETDEKHLRAVQKQLADLELQRQALFTRLLASE